MSGNVIIGRHLKRTSGFKDVPPTLLAGGEIGIYYNNTESTVEDGAEFKNYGENAGGMYRHAVSMMQRNPNFKEVIDILVDDARPFLVRENRPAISGGQTRDWLFSMPVAHVLGVPHISLYKPALGKPDKIEVHMPGGAAAIQQSIRGYHALHIVDLLTEGSSCHNSRNGLGWIPMLRNAGAEITDLVAVVSRLQGGEENLAGIGIKVHSEVAIDEEYLREHSENPEAVAYKSNTTQWCKDFLSKYGACMFARFFDPSGGKVERAANFMAKFGDHLKSIGKFDELDKLVNAHYKLPVEQIIQNKTRYDLEPKFIDRWREAVKEKNSVLCAGLDPADYWQANENTMPEGVDKVDWSLDFIDKIAPYSAAVKINGKFVDELSGKEKKMLVDRIHQHGMVAIWDHKLPDIGNTNDSGFYHADNFGFDAVTYSPFPGNFEEAAVQAHNRGMGVIGMCIMSNSQHFAEKNKLVDITQDTAGYHLEDILEMKHPKLGDRKYVPQFIQLAHDSAAYKWDGVVIGAPSPGNHVTLDEVARVKAYAGDNMLVLMPGVGAQGGDAAPILQMFGDNVIVNVGRAVLYAKDPAKEAQKYQLMLNELRKAA